MPGNQQVLDVLFPSGACTQYHTVGVRILLTTRLGRSLKDIFEEIRFRDQPVVVILVKPLLGDTMSARRTF